MTHPVVRLEAMAKSLVALQQSYKNFGDCDDAKEWQKWLEQGGMMELQQGLQEWLKSMQSAKPKPVVIPIDLHDSGITYALLPAREVEVTRDMTVLDVKKWIAEKMGGVSLRDFDLVCPIMYGRPTLDEKDNFLEMWRRHGSQKLIVRAWDRNVTDDNFGLTTRIYPMMTLETLQRAEWRTIPIESTTGTPASEILVWPWLSRRGWPKVSHV